MAWARPIKLVPASVELDLAAEVVPNNLRVTEMDDHLVAIDRTLTVSGGRALRERAAALGKPLAALIVTHAGAV